MQRRQALHVAGGLALAAVGGVLVAGDGRRPDSSLICGGEGTERVRDLASSPLSLTTADGPLGQDAGSRTVDAIAFELSVATGHVGLSERAVGVTADRTAPIQAGEEGDDQVRLSPGETHRWSLSRVPHPTPNDADTTYLTRDLDPGRYWFGVRLAYEPADGETETTCLVKRAFRVVDGA